MLGPVRLRMMVTPRALASRVPKMTAQSHPVGAFGGSHSGSTLAPSGPALPTFTPPFGPTHATGRDPALHRTAPATPCTAGTAGPLLLAHESDPTLHAYLPASFSP